MIEPRNLNMIEPMTADEAWQDLLDKDDRTSPADYPEMCLISREELAGYMSAARAMVMEAQGWTLQSSIYEGFSTEIWADSRPPGKRTVAIVRDFQDAKAILVAVAQAADHTTKAGLEQ